jgi:uncharacterized PurR-regulated membrane protein YhhQ (DUF165 family)
LYSLVVWWGTVSLSTAIQLGLAKYVFKLVIAACDTPFIYWARRWQVPGVADEMDRPFCGPVEPVRSSRYPKSVAQ